MSSQRYHHGGLREALLGAALVIVEGEGAAALSLRAAARAAGVSPMAPYHHFRDREALVAAVAQAGFERFYADKLAALAATDSNPVERAVAGARAYVAFVLEHPELYRLMKSPELADRSRHPELAAAANAPSKRLAELIGALAAEGYIKASPDIVGKAVWAFVHGLGMLAINRYLEGGEPMLDLAERGTRALIAGFAVGETVPTSYVRAKIAPGAMNTLADLT